METRSSKNQYLATIVICLSPFCYGLLVGWLTPVLAVYLSKETPLEELLSLEESSWLVSQEFLGNFTGVLCFVYLVDLVGRKPIACVSLVPLLISALLILFGRNGTHINVSRFFMGFGGGALFSSVPVYIDEIAEVRIRGKLGSMLMLNTNIGVSVGIVIGQLPYYTSAYVLVAASTISLILEIFILPETPTYLLQKGKKEKAEKVKKWFLGYTKHEELEELEVLSKIGQSIVIVPKGNQIVTRGKYKELFTRLTLKGLMLGIGLFFFQQGSGYFAVLYYSAVIFEEAESSLSPNASIVIVEVIKNIALLLANLLIERNGRRFLLMLSSIGVATTLSLIGVFMYLKFVGVDVAPYNWLPLVIISAYTFMYSIGLGVVPYVFVTEIFAADITPAAASICLFSYGVVAFVVCKFFSPLAVALEWHGCFWFFSVFSFIGSFFIWFCIPETKNKSSATILAELKGRSHVTHD